MEFIVHGKPVCFRVEVERELHCFHCPSGEVSDIVFFKYDRDGAWYCFSKEDKGLIQQVRAYCIHHYAGAPGYNDLLPGRSERWMPPGSV
ncbi:MAG: hypothetical protein JWP27_2596 [Flaviaesturariibacter sp.]|nr:hypothetical protein [Flaviaesturariibacter sp.]